MPSVHETVYPRFKSNINSKDLENLYTPTKDELDFANQTTRGGITKLCLILSLKSFQKLGYFVPTVEIPETILKYI